MAAEAITITLELRIDGDSLTGRATDSAGTVRLFTGWVGLLGVLDASCPPCAAEALAAGRVGSPDGDAKSR